MNLSPSRSVRRDAGLQILAMRRFFPDFRCHGSCGRYTFSGPLRPSDQAATYRVAIRYRHGSAPDVHVRSPELDADAPHLHSDGTLCLYHPHRRPWSSSHLVPWTAAWLLFYEEWLRLGVWLGPEAPHRLGDLK